MRDAVYRAAVRGAGLTPRDLLAVAVSGGPDSLTLLDALHAASDRGGPALHVLHFDHAWHRQSRAPAAALAERCAAYGLPLTCARASDPAPRRGESREMAARRLRRAFLDGERRRLGAARVATGHQADDQVETILMRLARGVGPDALGGMAVDDGRTLRPLLSLWRSQIEAYARALALPVHRDPSNDAPAHRRNRVRRELVPLLEHIYPGARAAVLRAGALAAPDVEPVVRAADGVRMPLAPRRRAVAAGKLRRVVQEAWWADGRPARQIGAPVWRALARALVDNAAGRWVQLPGGRWAFVRDRALALYDQQVSDPPLPGPLPLPAPGRLDLPAGRIEVTRAPLTDAPRRGPAVQIMAAPAAGALAVRTPRAGDRFVSPVDGRAHDLHRFLRRRRIPAALRAGTPIVTVHDQPACIPGLAVSAAHRPHPRDTEALHVTVHWTPLRPTADTEPR